MREERREVRGKERWTDGLMERGIWRKGGREKRLSKTKELQDTGLLPAINQFIYTCSVDSSGLQSLNIFESSASPAKIKKENKEL